MDSLPIQYRMLVADDDDALRETLCTVCARYFQVIAVEDGQTALDAIHRCPTDLVLCDLQMPVRSGLEVLREYKRVRQQGVGILMTAAWSPEVEAATRNSVIDDYLTKPFTREMLLTKLASVIAVVFKDATLMNQLQRPGWC